MAIRTVLWKVSTQPQALVEAQLPSEKLLEDMIVAAPKVLSDEWMLIGRQESTGVGGIIDLLAIAPDGALVLIELKRDRTPRDVVAQALDYAGWVEKLKPEQINAIYSRFAPGKNLAAEFQKAFGMPLDDDTLNQSHQIVIVSSSLDPSTERIVAYLAERDIPINASRSSVTVASNSSAARGCLTRSIRKPRSVPPARTTPGTASSTIRSAMAPSGHGMKRSSMASSAPAAVAGTAIRCSCSLPAIGSGPRCRGPALSASAASWVRSSQPATSSCLPNPERSPSWSWRKRSTTASSWTIRTAASTSCPCNG
jgi:hypothetical protein